MALYIKSTYSDEESFSCDLRHTFDVGCLGYFASILLIFTVAFFLIGLFSGKAEDLVQMVKEIFQTGIAFIIPISLTFYDKGRYIEIDKINKNISIYKINFKNEGILVISEPLGSVKNFGWDDEKIINGSEMGTPAIFLKNGSIIRIFTQLYKIEMNHLISSMNRYLQQIREGESTDNL